MKLSVKEAARQLGQDPRAVRYMIKAGTLPAHKEEGRWVIDGEDLPLGEGKIRARERQKEAAIKITREVIGKDKSSFRSVRDLHVFETGRVLLADLQQNEKVLDLVREALLLMSCGCHAYHAIEKTARFKNARDLMSRAAGLLHLDGSHKLGARLEAELLPPLGGLIRRLEGKKA